MKKLIMIVFSVLVLLPGVKASADPVWNREVQSAVFDEICGLVETHFCRPDVISKKWPDLKKEAKMALEGSSDGRDFSFIINRMLDGLNTSHTYYLTPADTEYYLLGDLFSKIPDIGRVFDGQTVMYPSVGMVTRTIGPDVFIASVFPESEAEKAGLLAGDEILAADGRPYNPIGSLKDRVGREVRLRIRRKSGGPEQAVIVKPALVNPGQEMLEAEKASIRLIEKDGCRIGYIHIYSYAGQQYHDVLTSAVSWGIFRDADALIVDLRYGLGGADPAYLNLFNPHVPVMTWQDNTGQTGRYDSQWRKPAVYLANEYSRSGKELLLFGARKYHLATVIGERSAGAVTAGRLFPMSNRDFLYLAVRTSEIDGVDLEGGGVAPDIEVPMDIRYGRGKDVQLERAVDYLLEKVSRIRLNRTRRSDKGIVK